MDYKEKVIALLNSQELSKEQKEKLESIFPELKESEDEKIRKALIEMVHDTTGDSLWVDYNVHKEDVLAWLEKQGKQNVDKVEPKFKVGDWVIDVQGVSSNQIIGYENDSYYIETSCSKFYLPMKLAEKNYRLWIIQDAKDGDVLYLQKDGKEHIIIYKGVIKERFRTFVSAYCAYNGIVDAFCFADVSRYVDIAYRGIMPATKEQRDILFKKMKEAGYEWDADKKELKKIEQKPAWSEEDKEILYGIIKDIEVLKEEGRNKDVKAAYQREIDWLKSLKDRVQPQPKQEWSEEDIVAIDCAVGVLSKDLPSLAVSIERLKSLRPQNTWKPSDEQMDALESAIIDSISSIQKHSLESLYNELKKLF